MGNLATNWLKRIFSVTTITTIATVLAACIAVIEYVERNGGTFMAIVNNKEVKTPIARNILVFLDKDSVDISQIGLFPQITNPSKYALQDVLLNYKITPKLSNVSYSDLYALHSQKEGINATNIDKTLYAKSDMPNPFNYFIMKDKGQASVNLRATYRGVETPFVYTASIYAHKLYVENKEERERDVLKSSIQFCQRHNLKEIDIYVIDNENIQLFENISKDSIKVELSIIDQAISEAKSVEQLKADIRDLKEKAQKEAKTPWYLYLAYIVLMFICFISITFLFVIFKIEKHIKDDKSRYHLKISLTVLISAIPTWYLMGLNQFGSVGSSIFWLYLFCFLGLTQHTL